MPVEKDFPELVGQEFYVAELGVAAARNDFADGKAPTIKIKCNTIIIYECPIADLQVAFNYNMFKLPITVDKHEHDNVIILKGKFTGVWLKHDNTHATKTLKIVYGNDIVFTHAHRHVIIGQDWFERNGDNARVTYHTLGVAPHGDTQRASYTCPAGKKAQVSIFMSIARATAAAPAALVRIGATLVGLGYVAHAQISNDNAVGARDSCNVAFAVILDAGDEISINTQDSSTGGTIDYLGTLLIREFDAP